MSKQHTAERHAGIQTWNIGAVVHVGFLTLRVYGKELDCGVWRLESLGGAKHYRFLPHHGLQRIH